MTPLSTAGPAAAEPPLPAGTPFGPDIVLLEHLRRGNDLDVFDAWSQERGTSVVIKMVRPDRRDRARTVARLFAEGDLLARLAHPHIVRCYEVLTDPLPAIVLETLGGRTLSALLDDQELSAPEIGHLGLHLAAAVRYLHRHGILHLDLKPSNVIEDGGRAKLLDLSVARAPGHAPPGIGTWCYQAPEQVTGGLLAPAADVWGLGVVLYEAATGIPAYDDPHADDTDDDELWTDGLSLGSGPWPAAGHADPDDGTDADASAPQLAGRPRPLRELRDLPDTLITLIDDCLAPRPDRRPTIDNLLARLEPIAGIPDDQRRFG